MPNGIRLDSGDLKRALADLARVKAPQAVAEALNKTAFEVLDGLEKEIGSAFTFSGPSTQRFLSRGFVFDKARIRDLAVTFKPKRGSASILAAQVHGGAVDPAEQLRVQTRQGERIAIPKGVPRGRRGRVSKSKTPGALLKRKGVFIAPSGDAILQRTGRRSVRVLYILVPSARIRPRVDYFGTIEKTARRELPKKAARVLEKRAARKG